VNTGMLLFVLISHKVLQFDRAFTKPSEEAVQRISIVNSGQINKYQMKCFWKMFQFSHPGHSEWCSRPEPCPSSYYYILL